MTEIELRTKVAEYLNAYLGIPEGGSRHKALLAIFNNSKLCTRYTMTVNDAWCATAVSAAFIACGLTTIFPCVECSCQNMIAKAQKAGIWVEADDYKPKMGDVILYSWSDDGVGDCTKPANHVGIVQRYDFGGITVIEGNYNDTVKIRTIGHNARYIRGFITPNYTAATTTEQPKADKYKGTLVTTDNLYLRAAAGKKSTAIAVMAKGSQVTGDGYYQTVDGTDWVHLRMLNKKGIQYTGYASSKHLRRV